MSCWDIISDYGLRSIGIGERLLPRKDFTLCHQVTLIGSGMIWNIYFGTLALLGGFFFSMALALGKASSHPLLSRLSNWFIFIFRGSPLFIQFFFAYFAFVSLKGTFSIFTPLSSAWLGALFVLFCNTAAYAGEIFYGALKAIQEAISKPPMPMGYRDGHGFVGSHGQRCCALAGLPTRMKRYFCFTLQRSFIFRHFPRGSNAGTRFITRATLPIKPLILLCLTQFWPDTLSYSR